MAKNLIKLLKLAANQNVAEDLDDEKLIKVGRDVVKLAKHDDATREDWKSRSKEAMDLALQAVKEKTFPWSGASNVKYPTVTVAALAFHARTLPAILSGNKIAKAKVTGEDKDGAKERQATRVAEYLNYQLLHEMTDWEDGMDKMLLALPIEGCEFKKTYFSPDKGTNESVWIRPEDFIVNYSTKSLDDCPRATHRIWMSPQSIEERMRMGIWSEQDLHLSETQKEEEELQEFYEQHCLLDLDGDDYKEPWCVTVHVKSQKVVRIRAGFAAGNIAVKVGTKVLPLTDLTEEEKGKATIAKIERIQYFTKYSFIPSPDGGFYDIGLGQIVGPINDSISTILNQIIDAGTFQNIAGNSGFVADGASVGNKRGGVSMKMGEFQRIKLPTQMNDIRQALMTLPTGGPSAVLFNTLGTLIGAAKDIAGVQDIHTGGTERNETATTTMIRVEEGQKVFNAIYKRIYRALSSEINKVYDLNAIYLDPETYFTVLDSNEQGVVTLEDFRNDGTDVQPMADPSMSNTAQKVAKAEALMQMMGNPLINKEEVTRRYLEALDVPNIDALIIDQKQLPPPPPDPKVLELELKGQELAMKVQQMKNNDENDDKRVLIEQFAQEVAAFKAETDRVKTEGELAVKMAGSSEASVALLTKMLTDLQQMDSTLEEAETETFEQGEFAEDMEGAAQMGDMQPSADDGQMIEAPMEQEMPMEEALMQQEAPIMEQPLGNPDDQG